ncbi:MAG: phospholipid scramblase-related protein [Bacteriovoracales bacterium]|nr:phospholipid scramblase-related protein [Bacteriovoracales bacterium]
MGESAKKLNQINILSPNQIYVLQDRQWGEAFMGYEQPDTYRITDASGETLGCILETGGSLKDDMYRQKLGSSRPLNIKVFDTDKNELMNFKRPAALLYGTITAYDNDKHIIGTAKGCFDWLNRKYELRQDSADNRKKSFASIVSPVWNLWKFPIFDIYNQKVGMIQKTAHTPNDSDLFKCSDTYRIGFPKSFSFEQRAIILAAVIMIDFNWFSRND